VALAEAGAAVPDVSGATATKQNPIEQLRIFDVTSRKVVTGSYETHRFVDTDETYKDSFGNERATRKRVTKTVDEFGYEVVFAVENPSAISREIVVKAGGATKSYLIKAGETRRDLTAPWTPRAKLNVATDRRTTSHNIPFPK